MYKSFSLEQDVIAIDSKTIVEMPIEDYKKYLRTGLLKVDDQGVLCSEPAGYPLAATREQFDELLSYLKEISSKLNGAAVENNI